MNRAPTEASNRRPIAARNLRSSQRMAAWLCRRGVSANTISLAGMIAGVLGGGALALTAETDRFAPVLWLAAAGLIPLRLIANMLDGMVALASGTASRIGEVYNEVPDRVSDSAILIGLGYAAGGNPALGYASALAAMATAYVRVLGTAAGAPATFSGPMAKQQRMFLATIAAVVCGIMPIAGLGAIVDETRVPAIALAVIAIGAIVTALRRLRTIARFLQGRP